MDIRNGSVSQQPLRCSLTEFHEIITNSQLHSLYHYILFCVKQKMIFHIILFIHNVRFVKQ